MNNYPSLDSYINFGFISKFSYFLSEVGEGDYTDKFSTDQIFLSHVDLIEWVRKIASDTTTGEARRKTFILLGYESSRKYRKYKPDVQPNVSSTRKCECLLRLRGKPKGLGWVLKVMSGCHNHDLAETLDRHPFMGRLNAVEQSILVDMTKSQVKISNILLTIKEYNEANMTTIKQIYNVSRSLDNSDVVSDVFWTHPDSVHLLNSFNIDFLMDTTYKTNKYRVPLLEIIGVTSTGFTFRAAFALHSSERKNNFTWALERFKGLLLTSEGGPRVVVTNRDLALINVIANVFSETYQMIFYIPHYEKRQSEMQDVSG
ncbi:protein FAR-RED ELONGATED HYPOCOTYL 3-like [Vigna angularis]|uniref:protein FAR-RED ELONGATED HYPOCOTYL 3-like n=1 Tax=Phaseolus angularis TaxID=3914 RepID=UPI0022B43D93|nr:protein FAR-RED ELONGATED HYPOCOTYL 3-like [Vigna angularis]